MCYVISFFWHIINMSVAGEVMWISLEHTEARLKVLHTVWTQYMEENLLDQEDLVDPLSPPSHVV